MLAISIMGPSWAHNLQIGYKLAALSFISVIIFFINNWLLLSVFL
ncbi:MAG: ABC transporter permease, partial [Rhodobacterales bacterium]|nr:ABC transporter permease [Rhodobacterales bacterium]